MIDSRINPLSITSSPPYSLPLGQGEVDSGKNEEAQAVRGAASRSAQGVTEKTSIVLSLPRQRTSIDAPIMALALPLPSRRPAVRPASGRPIPNRPQAPTQKRVGSRGNIAPCLFRGKRLMPERPRARKDRRPLRHQHRLLPSPPLPCYAHRAGCRGGILSMGCRARPKE